MASQKTEDVYFAGLEGRDKIATQPVLRFNRRRAEEPVCNSHICTPLCFRTNIGGMIDQQDAFGWPSACAYTAWA